MASLEGWKWVDVSKSHGNNRKMVTNTCNHSKLPKKKITHGLNQLKERLPLNLKWCDVGACHSTGFDLRSFLDKKTLIMVSQFKDPNPTDSRRKDESIQVYLWLEVMISQNLGRCSCSHVLTKYVCKWVLQENIYAVGRVFFYHIAHVLPNHVEVLFSDVPIIIAKGFPLANEGMTHSTLRILQCLLTAGAEKNQRMDEGLTPLHVAVLHGLLGMPWGVWDDLLSSVFLHEHVAMLLFLVVGIAVFFEFYPQK